MPRRLVLRSYLSTNLHADLLVIIVPNKHTKKLVKKVIDLIHKMMK